MHGGRLCIFKTLRRIETRQILDFCCSKVRIPFYLLEGKVQFASDRSSLHIQKLPLAVPLNKDSHWVCLGHWDYVKHHPRTLFEDLGGKHNSVGSEVTNSNAHREQAGELASLGTTRGKGGTQVPSKGTLTAQLQAQ